MHQRRLLIGLLDIYRQKNLSKKFKHLSKKFKHLSKKLHNPQKRKNLAFLFVDLMFIRNTWDSFAEKNEGCHHVHIAHLRKLLCLWSEVSDIRESFCRDRHRQADKAPHHRHRDRLCVFPTLVDGRVVFVSSTYQDQTEK